MASASPPSTESDAYKSLARRIFVPSFFILLQVVAAILIGYGHLLQLPFEKYAGIAALALSLPLFAYTLKNSVPRNRNSDRIRSFGTAPFLVLCVSASLAATVLNTVHELAGPAEKWSPRAAYGGLAERVDIRRYSREAVLRLHEEHPGTAGQLHPNRRILVYLPQTAGVRPGDEIAVFVPAKHATADEIRNSSYLLGLARRGIRLTAFPGENGYATIFTQPDTIGGKCRRSLETAIDGLFDDTAASLVKALYFGDATCVDKSLADDFKRAGVLHILAASGFNVGIVAAIPFLLLAPLRMDKRIILAAAVCLAYFYLYITGMPVSLLRAVIMFSVYALQRILDLDRNILNTLFISAVIILVIHPHELYETGFQLTYAATAGIILFYRFYRAAIPRIPSFFGDSIALTLSAQALVFPILLLAMREVNLLGVVSNLLLVPGTSAVFLLSMAACGLHTLCPWAAHGLGAVTGMVSAANVEAVRILADAGGHFFFTGHWSSLLLPYALYFMPVLPLPTALRGTRSIALAGSFICAWYALAPSSPRGDCILALKTPASAVIAYTRGRESVVCGSLGSPEDAEKLAARLNEYGFRRLILCLPKTDFRTLRHSIILLKKMVVRRCVIGTSFTLNSSMQRLCSILDADGTVLETRPLPEVGDGEVANPLRTITILEEALAGSGTGRPPDAPIIAPLRRFQKRLFPEEGRRTRQVVRLE